MAVTVRMGRSDVNGHQLTDTFRMAPGLYSNLVAYFDIIARCASDRPCKLPALNACRLLSPAPEALEQTPTFISYLRTVEVRFPHIPRKPTGSADWEAKSTG